MSQTLLLSGLDSTPNPVVNIHYSPELLQHPFSPPPSGDAQPKQSSWTQPVSSMETGQSFTARRSAASNLPTFQLPPPDHLSALHKYPAYAPSSAAQSIPAVTSSVLTPPAGLSGDGLSPLGSGVSASSQSSAGSIAPYQPMTFWSTPQNPSYNYSSAPSMPAPFAQQQSYMGRSIYSPPMNNFSPRNTHSPTAGEGLPQPPYDLSLPPFPTSMGSSGGQQQNLPTLAPQQQQGQQNQQNQQQQMDSSGMMNSQQASSQGPQPGSLHASDTYGGRHPPTPSYYNPPTSAPQQASFPAYSQQSPSQPSPVGSQPPSSRISPVSAQGYHSRPYNGYNLPAMTGPIMSNVHNPGNQMALVGGMNLQYPQHQMSGQHMYGHPGQQQPSPQNDRPFKCDQCPQSFNRNHDLKRHKRIHLAVKPFPCGHCEKSFSRKDALKVRSFIRF